MSITNLLLSLLISGVAGYFAGRIMHSRFSAPWNVAIGWVGGMIGNFIFGFFGFVAVNIIGRMIVSVLGACLCIWVSRKCSR